MKHVKLNFLDDSTLVLDFPKKDTLFFDDAFSIKSDSSYCLFHQQNDILYLPKNINNWTSYSRTSTENLKNMSHNNNFLFKGNNLLVLYAILSIFSESIKLIYIDPPYNTGNTFVYKDKFSRAIWLLFMKNRLEIARKFLNEEGIIVVQCDEKEHAYLKVLMDELYGENCFLGSITVQTNPGGRDYRSLARTHEYLLIYGKSEKAFLYPLSIDKNFPFLDDIGPFELRNLRNGNVRFHKGNRPNLCYPFYIDSNNLDAYGHAPVSLEKKEGYLEIYPKKTDSIQTVWRWGKQKSQENIGKNTFSSNLIARKFRDQFLIFEKYRKSTRLARTIWLEKEFQTSKGTKHLKEIFEESIFDYPKPELLLAKIMDITTKKGDRVLDFFLGSGTTATVAHKSGRSWIGIEQMDYISNITIPRICKVLEGEKGGASSHYDWNGGGKFVYGEFLVENPTKFPFYQNILDADVLTQAFYKL